jgi:hypothetical protein
MNSMWLCKHFSLSCISEYLSLYEVVVLSLIAVSVQEMGLVRIFVSTRIHPCMGSGSGVGLWYPL